MSRKSEPTSSPSGICQGGASKKRKSSCKTTTVESPVSLEDRASYKSNISQLCTYKTYSDSMQRHSEKFFITNVDETTNFSSENPQQNDSFQCAAERLRLGDERKSSLEVTTRSDLIFTDSIFSEIDVHSRGDEFVKYDKKSQSYKPFQSSENTDREVSDLVGQTDQKDKSQKLFGISFLNKSQIVAFLLKKGDKKKRKRKTNKELRRLGLAQIKTLDPPVPLEEDLETKTYIRSLYIYIIQLIFITLIAMSMVTCNMFYLTDGTITLFFDRVYSMPYDNSSSKEENTSNDYYYKTLRAANSIEDFWTFAENTLINMLYWDFYYSKMDPAIHKARDDRKLFNENQILGVARIRQVRVKNDSCKIHPDVQRFFDACYNTYSVFSEDTRPIKKGMEGRHTATAWVYTEAGELQSSYHWGEISIYGGGGYYIDLAPKKQDARNMIKELKENYWVTRATRAIFIDFNIYNANVNLFCICKIVLEFPPVGGILPAADFKSLKLIRYLTVFDFFILACEFVYILFVVYWTWKVIVTIRKQKSAFLSLLWNYLDVILIILSYLYIILSIVRYSYVTQLLDELEDRYYKYTEFHTAKEMQIAYNNVIAMLLFCSWVKLFAYFNFTNTMLQFKKTLWRSLKDMLVFFPMFFTMFSAFAFLAYLLFGSQVKGYNTVWHAFLTLLQAFLGEFDYSPILETNRILGPIFYISFVFFIFFVLLNVFIAIINDAYATVKSQVIHCSPKVGHYIRRGFVNTFTCCRPRRRKKLVSVAAGKRLLFEEIQKALKRAGFKKEEILIFFRKYNINCRNFLHDDTKTKLLKDLELNRINYSETSEQFQINLLRRRLDDFKERVENWERRLQPVIDKVDILLHRL